MFFCVDKTECSIPVSVFLNTSILNSPNSVGRVEAEISEHAGKKFSAGVFLSV